MADALTAKTGSSRLSGRVAVVTGGGRGIGRATCRALAAEGAAVAVTDIDRQVGEAVAQELTAQGARAIFIQTDVTNVAAVEAMARQVQATLGAASILINNAGVYLHPVLRQVPFAEITAEEWKLVLDVNLMGVVNCTKALLPQLRASGIGRIINMSSAIIYFGVPGYSHYAASKAALMGLSTVLARELGPDGIRVNCVAPGLVMTEEEQTAEVVAYHEARAAIRPVRKVETPEDVVGTIVFLASDDSNFITGQVIMVDGGMIMRR